MNKINEAIELLEKSAPASTLIERALDILRAESPRIAELEAENAKLHERRGRDEFTITHLQDSEQRRSGWLDRAKEDAGLPPRSGLSFDVVWGTALAVIARHDLKAELLRKINGEPEPEDIPEWREMGPKEYPNCDLGDEMFSPDGWFKMSISHGQVDEYSINDASGSEVPAKFRTRRPLSETLNPS